MNRKEVIERLASAAEELHGRFGVKEMDLFGSLARDEGRDDSDVDLLVEFQGKADFDHFMDLRFYLEELLGKRVDLVTRKALKPRVRAVLKAEAIRVTEGNLDSFLDALPRTTLGVDRVEIMDRLERERANWD